jgi:hypothetical protein
MQQNFQDTEYAYLNLQNEAESVVKQHEFKIMCIM